MHAFQVKLIQTLTQSRKVQPLVIHLSRSMENTEINYFLFQSVNTIYSLIFFFLSLIVCLFV